MKLIDFIVCDDVRHETGNKVSLMGIYQGDIIIQANGPVGKSIPMRLGIFVRLLVEEQEAMPDRFEITIRSDKKPLASMQGENANVEHKRLLQLAFVAHPLPIRGNTVLEVAASFYKGEELLLSQSIPDGVSVKVVDRNEAAS